MRHQTYPKNPQNDAKSFAANLSWLVFSGVVNVANSVLIWVFMARWRDAEELGKFTILMGLYALFYNICSLNLSPLLVREISRRSIKFNESLREFNSTAAVFLLASGTICTVLMTASGFLLSSSAEVWIANAVLSLALIPTATIALGEANAVASERGSLIAATTTLENILRTGVPLFLIVYGFPLWMICVSFVAVRVVTAGIYFFAGKITDFVFSKQVFFDLFKAAPLFGGTIILSSVTWQMPMFLVARFASEIELARYGVAARFLIPATIFTAGFANAIQPALVREWEKSVQTGANYLLRRAGLISLATITAAALSPFLSKLTLTILFGETYAGAAQTLDLLAISVVPFALVVVVARGLIAANAAQIDLIANAVGALICLTTGIWLVPRFGAAGAAAAQIVAFALMALIEIIFLTHRATNSAERRVWA